jgi:phage shock protein A
MTAGLELVPEQDDAEELASLLAGLRVELEARHAELRADVGELAERHSELRADVAELRADVAELRQRWAIGPATAMAGVGLGGAGAAILEVVAAALRAW